MTNEQLEAKLDKLSAYTKEFRDAHNALVKAHNDLVKTLDAYIHTTFDAEENNE